MECKHFNDYENCSSNILSRGHNIALDSGRRVLPRIKNSFDTIVCSFIDEEINKKDCLTCNRFKEELWELYKLYFTY